MHMADALLSPAVGGTMWAVTAGMIYTSSRAVGRDIDEMKVPLMGVLGAFIFAVQMINFAIPGTGSSGHLGGGLLLAVLLGPHAAFLTLASVLTVQALFFADGGLLALGSNIFNLGFFPCFIAYPLLYKKIVGPDYPNTARRRLVVGSVLAAVVGLQLGSFGVVLETYFSNVAEISLSAFFLLMQPVHLAIGLVEGLATAAVISFVAMARPEIFFNRTNRIAKEKRSGLVPVLLAFIVIAGVTGGVLSKFASDRPDGLEWSLASVLHGQEVEASETGVHGTLAGIQNKTALMPDYVIPAQDSHVAEYSNVSLAGLLGGFITLFFAGLTGLAIRKKTFSQSSEAGS